MFAAIAGRVRSEQRRHDYSGGAKRAAGERRANIVNAMTSGRQFAISRQYRGSIGSPRLTMTWTWQRRLSASNFATRIPGAAPDAPLMPTAPRGMDVTA